MLQSGSYQLGRLLVGAGKSPRALLRLPLDLFRLARSRRKVDRPPGPGSPDFEAIRHGWSALADGARSAGEGKMVLLFSGTTYIQGTRGNRPIRQAQALTAHGAFVFFSYHRSRFADGLPVPSTDHLLQSPVDITIQLLSEIAATDLPTCNKLFVISYPYPGIERFVAVFRQQGWTTVYDCRDDWEEFAKVGMARWFDAKVEHQILSEVDVTLCVSRPLVEKMRSLAPSARVELMPNAVEAGFLPDGYLRQPQCQPRRVGYFGHLSSAWFDWDALAQIASNRPDYRFEIIGHSAPQDLALPKNVHLLGPVPWEELHAYAACWSAGIIPFRMGKLADAVDPIKIYEYLAFGLPVVSFRMPQIENYPYTTTVETVDAFCEALDRACATETRRDVIEVFLARNTWDSRAKELLSLPSVKRN
ncbi:glycosyltransferase [Nitratireductor sp. CH_MIT9313-5]|uniref:glycosyltransferase n=1 Tax=Nitratireductor sp. CH_MIT9313-5 TaxID=3107764 RepID=UPI00300A5465